MISGHHRPKHIWLDFVLRALAGSEDKCNSERPVNSSIICCLYWLIKHITGHLRTNDSHPITHKAEGLGRTTTWPRAGLTGLGYGVRVYLTVTAVTLLCLTRSPSYVSGSGSQLCQKTVGRGKMQLLQDYHTASVWLFWLNSWIYMNPSCISIWTHHPPTYTHTHTHIHVWLVAFSLFLQSMFLQED